MRRGVRRSFPGGFTEQTAKVVHAKKPTEVVRHATYGMLPRNRLRIPWMKRLHLFEDEDHPYAENIYAALAPSREAAGGYRIAPHILRVRRAAASA